MPALTGVLLFIVFVSLLGYGDQSRPLEGHQGLVDAVAITADGRRVVSGSWDKTLKVWDLETGALICTFNCEGCVDCAAVAPDGRTFVAGDAGGRVYFLRLENRCKAVSTAAHSSQKVIRSRRATKRHGLARPPSRKRVFLRGGPLSCGPVGVSTRGRPFQGNNYPGQRIDFAVRPTTMRRRRNNSRPTERPATKAWH